MKRFLTVLSVIIFGWTAAQKTHTVQQGDTPFAISKKYGISLQDLYKLNPTVKEGTISIGQNLIVSGNPKDIEQENVQIIIQPKQTIYGLTKQYNISEATLRKLNPDLEASLKIGDKITIPASLFKKYGEGQPLAKDEVVKQSIGSNPKADVTPTYTSTTVKDDAIYYIVQAGDTTFGIINKFNVSLEDLMQYNPQLSNGLKAGMEIKIKKIAASYVKKSGEELDVAILLPFGYQNGDSKFRELSLDFLMGAKLALERNAKAGQKLNVKVIDAGNEATFKNSLSQIQLDATDLIIGPFFKSSVLEVLDYVKGNKIPVVAPFANSEDLYKYENLIIIETDEQVYADKIAQEVTQAYANEKIYIVSGTDKQYANSIKASIEKKLSNATVEIVASSANMKLDNNMMTGQSAPVIAVLADKSSSEGTNFGNKMIELSKETAGIKAFSMFYASIFDSKIEDLKAVSLVYLMDRKINMDGTFETEILADYKTKYCKTPSKYAVIGFDVVNDMLQRENKKGEIFKQITKTQTQLATKFEFKRVNGNGAYLNTGYRVVRLMP